MAGLRAARVPLVDLEALAAVDLAAEAGRRPGLPAAPEAAAEADAAGALAWATSLSVAAAICWNWLESAPHHCSGSTAGPWAA